MTRSRIFECLTEIFKGCVKGAEKLSIAESSNLRTDLGINSIGIIYIVISIEEELGVDMANASFSSFETVKDVIDYIEENI